MAECAVVRLCVVVPTIGRRTMRQATASASAAWMVETVDGHGMPWGNGARNEGVRRATMTGATHVAYLDDDDAYVPGAVDKVVGWCECDPTALHLGRMVRAEDGVVWWRDQVIRCGNVGSPMIVAPAWAAAACPWSAPETGGYDADWRHARDVAALTGRVVWHEDVIAVVRPWGRV